MPTSDERREVAARLREEGRVLAKLGEGSETASLTLDDVLGVSHDGTWEDQFDRLADLIEPTCEVIEVPDNDEFMIRVVSGFMCKKCGHEAIVERNCDGSAEPPRYCPCCGARVTNVGERP